MMQTTQQDLVTRLRARASAQPNHEVLREGGEALTVVELERAAASVAAYLIRQLGPGAHHVGIRAAKARTVIVASLGIAQAGMVSVVIDVRDPQPRVEMICRDAVIAAIVTDSRQTPAVRPLVDIDDALSSVILTPELPAADLDAPSCITYSSGSTGAPKGIVWSQRARAGLLDRYWSPAIRDWTGRMAIPHIGSVTNSEIALIRGVYANKTIVPYPINELGFTSLADWLEQEGVGGMLTVPTVVRHLLQTLPPGRVLPLDWVEVYGERLLSKDVMSWREHFHEDAVIVDVYAAMETAGATYHDIRHDTPVGTGAVPVGWPGPGRYVEILDEDGGVVSEGEYGEVAISGYDLPLCY